MAYIQGEGRHQGTLFPVVLDDLVPADHVCRVIDAFIDRLKMEQLGFVRAEAADTGRPGYDPRDLLKLYLYGYLHTIRSSRRLEVECRRNVELMWLLGRLYPDHKSIAEFRRMHREAVTAAGAELIQFARSVGLIRGEWVAIDGSKFRAASSARSVLDREALQRYLDQMENADSQQETTIDGSAVSSALEKLRTHPEPEARFMRTADGKVPAYNVQTAVDAEHALIMAHQVSTAGNDNSRLQPMAEAVRVVLGSGTEPINIVADTGYSNGEQAAICEASGLIPHIPAKRSVNSHGDGTLLDRTAFTYQSETDSFRCPAGQTLKRKQLYRRDLTVYYQAQASDCAACRLKPACTQAPQRIVSRNLNEETLDRMHQRATPQVMRLRRSTVEHPFANLKYRIFGHPRFLMRGLGGTHAEISLAVMAYNLKRMVNILGGSVLATKLIPT
jgi:transposase